MLASREAHVSDRFLEAVEKHMEAVGRLGTAISSLEDVRDVEDPNTADIFLDFIRSLQDIADTLDEHAKVPDLQPTERVAFSILAAALIAQGATAASSSGVPRPFRHLVSLFFPNELVVKLKGIRDGVALPAINGDYDA